MQNVGSSQTPKLTPNPAKINSLSLFPLSTMNIGPISSSLLQTTITSAIALRPIHRHIPFTATQTLRPIIFAESYHRHFACPIHITTTQCFSVSFRNKFFLNCIRFNLLNQHNTHSATCTSREEDREGRKGQWGMET